MTRVWDQNPHPLISPKTLKQDAIFTTIPISRSQKHLFITHQMRNPSLSSFSFSSPLLLYTKSIMSQSSSSSPFMDQDPSPNVSQAIYLQNSSPPPSTSSILPFSYDIPSLHSPVAFSAAQQSTLRSPVQNSYSPSNLHSHPISSPPLHPILIPSNQISEFLSNLPFSENAPYTPLPPLPLAINILNPHIPDSSIFHYSPPLTSSFLTEENSFSALRSVQIPLFPIPVPPNPQVASSSDHSSTRPDPISYPVPTDDHEILPEAEQVNVETFVSVKVLDREEGTREILIFSCPKCSVCFSSSDSLEAHKRHVHRTDLSTIPCLKCSEVLGSKNELTTHVSKMHKEWEKMDTPSEEDLTASGKRRIIYPEIVNPETETPQVVCPVCQIGFGSSESLKRHQLQLHVPFTSNIQCPVCLQPLRCDLNLRRHLENVHNGDGITIPCDVDSCSAYFNKKSALTLHKRKCHGIVKRRVFRSNREFVYKCQHCSYTSPTIWNIKRHTYSKHKNEE